MTRINDEAEKEFLSDCSKNWDRAELLSKDILTADQQRQETQARHEEQMLYTRANAMYEILGNQTELQIRPVTNSINTLQFVIVGLADAKLVEMAHTVVSCTFRTTII